MQVSCMKTMEEYNMRVEYVKDRFDNEFTLNKKYEFDVKPYGIEIVDDLNNKHVIATKNNGFNSYEEDDFFRHRFEFCD